MGKNTGKGNDVRRHRTTEPTGNKKGVRGKTNLPVPPVRLSLMAATMQMT